MSTSSPEPLKPTPGLRVEARSDEDVDEPYVFQMQHNKLAPMTSLDQSIIDAAYINQCIEDAEQRAVHLRRPEDAGDLMVDLGDLTNAKLGTLVQDEAYETQVMDYIDTFNHAVLQGVPPFRAVRAMSQAFSLVMVNCLRANLSIQVAVALLQSVVEATKAAATHLKIITSSQRHN